MNSAATLKQISTEIERLVAISKEPVTITKKAGQTVIKEGAAADVMYVVKYGSVDIKHSDVRLERVTKGGIVGEMAIIDDAPRSASVIAHKDSVLIPISRDRFMYLVQKKPEFALSVMNTMIRRLRQMNVRLDMASQKGK